MERIVHHEMQSILAALDWRSVELLRILEQAEETWLSTSDVRAETGFSNSQVRYRREKLAEYDLIDVRDARTRDDATPPKMHAITDRGRWALKRGGLQEEFDVPPAPGDFDELAARLERVEETQDALRSDLWQLKREIQDVADTLETRVGGTTAIDEQLDDIYERLDRLENKGGFFR